MINLMRDLQREFGLAYLFIAHDLSVVQHISDEVAIMYLGRIVETGPKPALFANPLHPYTQGLLLSVPSARPEAAARRARVPGRRPAEPARSTERRRVASALPARDGGVPP